MIYYAQPVGTPMPMGQACVSAVNTCVGHSYYDDIVLAAVRSVNHASNKSFLLYFEY